MISKTSRRLLDNLTWPLTSDAFVDLVDPLRSSRLRGVVEQVRPLTSSAASIVIRPGRSWKRHQAGQFVTVGVDVDGVRHHRCYSLTSVPGDSRIEITVQATDGGVVSNHLVHSARPGDIVQLEQASGDFVLPKALGATADPILFVTGGSGITPAIGMIRSLVASACVVDTVLLHHATSADRLLFADELAQLAADHPWLRVEIVLTRTGAQESGRLNPSRLDQLCADWRGRTAYVSGPDPMLNFAIEHWEASGLTERLHLERFTPGGFRQPASPSPDGQQVVARFAKSDVEVWSSPDTPLLEVAEGAGLTPAFGCRMGVCHTCTTRLVEGCVRDLRDGSTTTAGEHVRLCISAAADGVVLDL